MREYEKLRVPDLKTLLTERALPVSGYKAELIARLQYHDKESGGGEDEIDWDEDDAKPTSEPAAAAVAAGGLGAVKNPRSVPNQKVDTDPSKTTDLKVTSGANKPIASGKVVASAAGTMTEGAPEPEAPKQDFSMGIVQTNVDKEAEKRAARAKRFGLAEDQEEKKKAERAKKFGSEAVDKDAITKGLDAALSQPRAKRSREDKQGGQGGRSAKRQTPDRTMQPRKGSQARTSKRIIDDPVEKAKAEARAAKFGAKPTAA